MASDGYRHNQMLGTLEKTCAVIGDMHWTLVAFGKARLVTSDHPVTLVPLSAASVAPVDPFPVDGLMNQLEIRVAVTPWHALVLTWMPGPDPTNAMTGKPHHARALNAAVIAQAEQHWFYLPGTSPQPVRGVYGPVSFDLFRSYNAAVVNGSERRARCQRKVNAMIEATQDPTGGYEWSRVSHAA